MVHPLRLVNEFSECAAEVVEHLDGGITRLVALLDVAPIQGWVKTLSIGCVMPLFTQPRRDLVTVPVEQLRYFGAEVVHCDRHATLPSRLGVDAAVGEDVLG